ncbi:STAS domain-containing protein [Bacillus sp. FJAT-45037]|uniref:STAS domain-containing protein n=1 Tax=Bacillus sp. FJAT-45037 TaxID=2011007 RepID=UPI001E5DC841|nr:STAS domain-containing protein [Bacillus sp. FJAT-45037]
MLNVSEHLISNAESLANEILENILHQIDGPITDSEKDQGVQIYLEFIKYFGESIDHEKESNPDFLIEWSKSIARQQVTPEARVSEIIAGFPLTRAAFADVFLRISKEYGLSLDEHAFLLKRMNQLLDLSLNETVIGFERLTDEFKVKTKKELAKLSAPLVPVQDGIVILPIVGEVDQYLSAFIMEQVIPDIAQKEVTCVIADFSGVRSINNDNASYLHEIVNMLQLMGINIILTGMHPETARIAVSTGVSMIKVKSYLTVQVALNSIN